jgi:hypothetical protein
MDLDEVADGLYAAPPDDFVRLRDAAAREAQQAGDRILAGTIGKLRRPSAGAWLSNLLAHRHATEVGRLAQLGVAMREAQATLDVEALRTYGKERHQLVTELVGLARASAAEQGTAVGGPAVQELESTLTAAVADQDASDLLVAGRLAKGLSYSGFGGPGLAPATRPKPKQSPKPAVKSDPRVDEAERDLAQARLQGAHAESMAEAAAERVRRAQEVVEAAEQELAERAEQLQEAEQARDEADTAVTETATAIAEAERALERLLG